MEQDNLALLEAGLHEYGVEPTPGRVKAIVRHLEMVIEWNERVNLTAITQERDMVVKHVIDSLSALSMLKVEPGTSLLDVGAGAGFPGVVLKCVEPGARVVLLESLQKRCKFLEAVGNEVVTPLKGKKPGDFAVVWGRAEDQGKDLEFRERYDVVVARAVAELRVLTEYCLPFVKLGGHFLAMKGPNAGDELNSAAKAIDILGGQVEQVSEINLPEGAGARTLILVKKVQPTPRAYPRKAGTPAKEPL